MAPRDMAAVTKTLVLVGNKAVDSPPKSRSSRRQVALAPPVVAALEGWREAEDDLTWSA